MSFISTSTKILLLAVLTSCVSPTIDYMTERAEYLVERTAEKLKEVKTETIQEVSAATATAVDDGLQKMGATLDGTLNKFLNSDAVAFITVATTGLLSLVVIAGLYVLILRARKVN